MNDWQHKYDEHSQGWLECMDYLSKKLPAETYQAVFGEVKKLFKSQNGGK